MNAHATRRDAMQSGRNRRALRARWRKKLRAILAAGTTACAAAGGATLALPSAPILRNPEAIVDLRTAEGVKLVRGQWLYADARIVPAEFRAAGADLTASGPHVATRDVVPKAGAADFDDASWNRIEPAALEQRRTPGKLAFGWYRIRITVPERVGSFTTAGATVALEVVADDYSEVWVDGKLPRTLGQTGGPLVGGFNAPNRLVLTRAARPGQQFQLAVFAANGPLSDPPSNYVWIRSATLDFYRQPPAAGEEAAGGEIERLDPAMDLIAPLGTRIEKLAGGFQFTEGPVWVKDGYLLFSDPNANTIYRWSPDDGVSIFRVKSGYSGFNVGEYRQPGSNGLALDREGRLTVCEHGNRRVSRIEKNGTVTVLADRYEGKRLNSPNDLVYRSDGSLYFTDPYFGLPRFTEDPGKELSYSGIFRVADGKLQLLSADLKGPNGLAFSPDEKTLYVANWDTARKIVMKYPVREDGSLSEGSVLFDMNDAPGEEALDGLKVDSVGNLYVSGPGGVWVLSKEGRHLGTIRAPELPANFAWGDEDGKTLYMAARTGLYRVRLGASGAGW